MNEINHCQKPDLPPTFTLLSPTRVQPSGVWGFNSCALSYLGCQYTSRIAPPAIPRANHVSYAAASEPSPCNLSNARPARCSVQPTYLHHSGFSLTYKTDTRKKKKKNPSRARRYYTTRSTCSYVYFNNRMSSIYKFNAPVAHAYI